VKNVRLDDEAVLDSVSVTEAGALATPMPLTATQQALLLGLWSVIPSSTTSSSVIAANS